MAAPEYILLATDKPQGRPWSTRMRHPFDAFRPPRKLRITREGKYYLGITLGVGFAAINTGNNLLYLLLGLLLALIVISGVLSELSLRHLRVQRRLPRRAQAERPHIVEIEVFNEKRRMPSYAIEVEDLRAGHSADKRCFYLKVSPQSAQVAAYRRTPAKRGLDRHIGFRVATRYPFGLFEKSREIPCDGTLITYPAVDSIRLVPSNRGKQAGGDASISRGQGDEILGVRPMREGDDPRDIYWRRSANPDQMLLKERAHDAKSTVELFLDDTFSDIEKLAEQVERFERRIREVASRAVAHLRRGEIVQLRTSSGQRVVATPTVGADAILTFLALVAPVHRETVGSLSPRSNRRKTPADETAEPYPSIPLSTYPDSSTRRNREVEGK
ncbi:MAG: DUF58 domain-containing protein [Polyangiaceae bacterium]